MVPAIARVLIVAAIAGLVALGVWQLERMAWKRALIADVAAKLGAAPVAPPAADRPADPRDAYRRVILSGRFVARRDMLVQAVTAIGGGFWVMTPIDTARGRVLVNRGFVPGERRTSYDPAPPGMVRVTGLMRLSEPGGGFLRDNDAAAERWYSRDVRAIAAARRLGPVAPWFVDADAAGTRWPRGGMTVVAFRDNHLAYALTWFAMAALLGWLGWRASRGSA